VRIPFATKEYSNAPLSAESLVNMYPEAEPQSAKSNVGLFGCPGVETQVTLGSGPVRGATVMDGILFAVSGSRLYKVEEDLTTTNLGGNISGTANVSMDNNGSEIVVVNGSVGYIWDAVSGFRIVSDAEFTPADTVGFIDSYFLFNRTGTGIIFRSDSLDGTSYLGTAFATAEGTPDDTLAVFPHKDILYVFGRKSIEPFVNTGAANFPFQVLRGSTINRGVAGSFAIAEEDESIFFLGDDRVAYILAGRSIQRISNHAIETVWQDYGSVSDAICVGS